MEPLLACSGSDRNYTRSEYHILLCCCSPCQRGLLLPPSALKENKTVFAIGEQCTKVAIDGGLKTPGLGEIQRDLSGSDQRNQHCANSLYVGLKVPEVRLYGKSPTFNYWLLTGHFSLFFVTMFD